MDPQSGSFRSPRGDRPERPVARTDYADDPTFEELRSFLLDQNDDELRELLALDGSEHAHKAMDLACEMAHRFGAELIALHAIPDRPLSDAERKMAEIEFHAEIAQRFDLARLTDAQGNAR